MMVAREYPPFDGSAAPAEELIMGAYCTSPRLPMSGRPSVAALHREQAKRALANRSMSGVSNSRATH